jgi:hypothetical protein
MGNETFKKRQKKATRLSERRNQRANTDSELQEEPTTAPQPKELAKIGGPKYFSCLIRPKDPRKKSEITLYATRK